MKDLSFRLLLTGALLLAIVSLGAYLRLHNDNALMDTQEKILAEIARNQALLEQLKNQ